MDSLILDNLPPLPQVQDLRRLAERVWQQEGVVALWLSGSFAHGVADAYSDVDLGVAVSSEAFGWWERPDFELLFAGELVGRFHVSFGPNQILHQVVLANGHMIDLAVQTADQNSPLGSVKLIDCRDEEYRRLFTDLEPDALTVADPADPAIVAQVVTDFWIATLKTHKVLHRDLDLIALVGIQMEHAVLKRLWYVLATGNDMGTQRTTIHTMTSAVRGITSLQGHYAQELLGLPLRDRAEVQQAVEANRNEVARVGRLLAARLGFEYPLKLENTVRSAWTDFLEAKQDVQKH